MNEFGSSLETRVLIYCYCVHFADGEMSHRDINLPKVTQLVSRVALLWICMVFRRQLRIEWSVCVCVLFFQKGFLCGWPGTQSVDQVGLELSSPSLCLLCAVPHHLATLLVLKSR